jgi:predicted metal-dependent phosphoesterase TrpH
MIIDLHTHEILYSACSRMTLEQAVDAAKETGLDGICITDHDSLNVRYAEYLRETDFPVFVGVEMYTKQGDMIAFGLEYLPKAQPTAQEFINFVATHNGFCYAAHPFRACGGGVAAHIYELNKLPGIEVLNGANTIAENNTAMQACRKLNCIPVAGSDAHFPEDVGRYATWFPDKIGSESELVTALKSGKGRPAILEKGQYTILDLPV